MALNFKKPNVQIFKFKTFSQLYDSKPYSFPAKLVQRFGAFVLDIGVIILLAALINAAYKIAFDIPFERPRYRPPDPDMGWDRVFRSFAFICVILAILSVFISKFHQATLGMNAFFIKAVRTNGHKLSFLRAFGWNFTMLAPLLLANYLVLIGVKLDYSLSHIGRVNVFALMLIVQAALFLPILFRADKRSLYDMIWDVKVIYYDEKPNGLHPMRQIFMLPFLLAALLFLSGLLGWGTLNIFDRPLDPRIEKIDALKPNDYGSLYKLWREDPGFDIEFHLPSYHCASQKPQFQKHRNCPPIADIKQAIQTEKDAIFNYKTNILSPTLDQSALFKYLTREGLQLTDLVLADLIIKWEENPSEQNFENWLLLLNAWERIFLKGALLLAETKIIIHYNHILFSLPILLDGNQSFAARYKDQLESALRQIPFDQGLIDRIMAHEYAAYNAVLERSLVDYLPFIQPNATRNYFVAAIIAANHVFPSEDQLNDQLHLLTDLNPFFSWYQIRQLQSRQNIFGALINLVNVEYLYNPLGLALRDLAIKNFSNSLPAVTNFHHNNAGKTLLYLYVRSALNETKPENMADFLATLPNADKIVLQTQQVRIDQQKRTLYYHPPGLPSIRDGEIGYRRELQF